MPATTIPHALAEAIGPAEEDLRESLSADPNNWDAKYNLEYVNYIRMTLEKDREEGMKVLPQVPTQDSLAAKPHAQAKDVGNARWMPAGPRELAGAWRASA